MTSRRALAGLLLLAIVGAFWVLRVMETGPEAEEVVTDVAVHVTPIARATLRDMVAAYGRVEPEPASADQPAGGALITPFVDGVVVEIDAVEGRETARGTVLFRLDARLSEVAVERGRQQVAFAEQALARQEALLASDGTSQRAYLEARQQLDSARSDLAAAEIDLAYRSITSPLNGTVVRLTTEVGQHVDATSVLAQVMDMDRLVVTVGVPADQAGGIAVGQPVLLGSADPAPIGTVQVLGRNVDLATGTYRVQASVPPGSGLVPGQFMEVHIVTEEHVDVPVVPEVSVVTDSNGGSWIAVVEDDRAVRRNVTVGLRERGLTEVSGDGIADGLTVVTEEAYSLPENTAIHVVDD